MRGKLRIYLGPAPGVGKTFAMLDEGWRRRERGTDVVVGLVVTHGRPKTAAQIRDLEIIAPKRVEYRDRTWEEVDIDAILARRPQVALIDELAHTNVPGSQHEKRWQDIDRLLATGIEVISTVNIQHLESVNDVVNRITGVVQRETVPDAVVRRADQIELVDMSPEALQRRMAHGNIYAPEKVDAALANYFRAGNLGALRELALLWLADRVEDSLQAYMHQHGITEPWETRERVMVALTGAPGNEQIIRRAARMARRAHGDLVGVHVANDDGLKKTPSESLSRHRTLLEELGGTYHTVTGTDVPATLVRFAAAQHVTQLVLGTSRRSRWAEITRGSVINRVVRASRGIDVHVISTEDESGSPRGGRGRIGRRAEARRERNHLDVVVTLADRLAQPNPTQVVVDEIQHTLARDAAALLAPTGDGWIVEAHTGEPAIARPDDGERYDLRDGHVLVMSGPPLPAEAHDLVVALLSFLEAATAIERLSTQANTAGDLARTSELRNALLAAVSHDLRTPLASIKALASGWLEPDVDWSPADTREFMVAINGEADRLHKLVENLLDMSRLQSGVLQLDRRASGLDEIVPAALASLTDGAPEIVVDIPEDLPRVDVDPTLLERAVANLVDNAVRHSGEGAAVRVEAAVVAGRVDLRIVDRGCGIPRSHRERVFQPFQRLGDTENDTGVGLGLAVARGFVDAVGGELTLEDTPGGGVTMVIGLPIASENAKERASCIAS